EKLREALTRGVRLRLAALVEQQRRLRDIARGPLAALVEDAEHRARLRVHRRRVRIAATREDVRCGGAVRGDALAAHVHLREPVARRPVAERAPALVALERARGAARTEHVAGVEPRTELPAHPRVTRGAAL